ncbi:MAG: hypothetical protein ACI9BW_000157 [Gammaproteobacteria bacterium]|jgi:uncharacterized protein involved in outer membrane biogenesis
MKWFMRIVFGVVVVAGLLCAYVATLDVNQYKSEIVNYVTAQTGRAFSIDGDIGLKLALVPTIKIEGVTFGNSDWAAHGTMATAQRIEAQLALLPLFYGQLSVKKFAVVGARVSIEINREGRGNWILDRDASDSVEPSSFRLPEFDFQEISVRQVVVEYRMHEEPAQEIALDVLRINSTGFGQPVALVVGGAYQQRPFNLQGQLSPLNRLIGNEPYAIDINGSFDAIEFSMSGEIEQPLDGQGVDLGLEIHVPELASVATMFDLELAPGGPLDVSTELTDRASGYGFSGVKVVTQRSQLGADLVLKRTAKSWDIVGELYGSRLDTGDVPKLGSDAANSPRVFSEQALELSWLEALEADIDLSIESVVNKRLELSTLKGKIEVGDGRINVSSVSARINEGTLNADISLDASTGITKVALDIRIDALMLGDLAVFAQDNVISNGLTVLNLKLKGKGRSMASILANANGVLDLETRDAIVNHRAAGLVSGDLLSGFIDMLNPRKASDGRTRIECGVVHFPIVNGIATNSTGIGLRTPELTILGGGSVSLKDESIDIGIKPKPRTGVGLNVSGLIDFVRLGGTLHDPKLVTDVAGAATAGLKVGAAVATAGLSILAEGIFDRLTADHDACAIALGKEKFHDQDADRPSIIQNTTTKTRDVLENAGAKVKGVFKGLFGR